MFQHEISYLTGRTVQETFVAGDNLKAKVAADGPDSVKGFPVKIIAPHTVELCSDGNAIDGQIFNYEKVDDVVSVTTLGNVRFESTSDNLPTFGTHTIVADGTGKVKKVAIETGPKTHIRLLDTDTTPGSEAVICKL